ncbi:MAG: cation diffusion facilitator family transporter, partial [Alphaproteobacteria bacterium]
MPHDGHDHAGHNHHPKATTDNERRVLIVLALTGSYMVVEVIGGVISGSLALIADAGHMLTDTAALGLSWFAFRMARRPADKRRSYGYHRLQVVAAFVNGIVLVALTGWIVIEAGIRMFDPVPV